MFGKKKSNSTINAEQLEQIQYAQKRIRQKKRLYIHFVVFLIAAVFIIVANTVLGIGKDFKIANIDWFVYAILLWFFVIVYHFVNVFIINKFMNKAWENKQLDKLVAQQEQRIEKLKQQFLKEASKIAQTKAVNELNTSKTPQIKEKNKGIELTIIVAAGEDNSIGKDNDLIWHLSNDLKRFKELTNGHHIIMGRKTFESFPNPLPNRTHVVITRQKNYEVPNGVIVVHNLDDAIDAVKNDSQPFIIGGGEIYEQSMGLVDKIEITRVHANFPEADTFFPEIDGSIWRETNRILNDEDEKHDYGFSFITYVKR